MTTPKQIPTRILILSDTHGAPLSSTTSSTRPNPNSSSPHKLLGNPFRQPLPHADVVLHAGDLTYTSSLSEYVTTFSLLRSLSAPLKLVIPGNHDIALDKDFWHHQVERWSRYESTSVLFPPSPPPADAATEDAVEHARLLSLPNVIHELITAARRDGVYLLLEGGLHTFVLPNGSRLRIYTSPQTPRYGDWAFQYSREEAQNVFAIDEAPEEGTSVTNVDIVMTHGPAYGILDYTAHGGAAGCPSLLSSLARSRPRLHCFGHIHEGWGARVTRWSRTGANNVVDEAGSVTLEDLSRLEERAENSPETNRMKLERYNIFSEARCRYLNMAEHGDKVLDVGKETLSVNAAIMDLAYRPVHLPFLVDLTLDGASELDREKAQETEAVLLSRAAAR